MRPFLLALGLTAFAVASSLAGQLDFAVIQFPEAKDQSVVEQAFSNVSLAEITNSNRTMTTESDLKGGYVIFAQSMPINPGSSFNYSTRIGNDRADVQGKLGKGSVAISVELIEGVKAGLRSYQNRIYEGAGSLPDNTPRILSIKQSKGKAPGVIRGQATMNTYGYTTVVVAQYSR